MGLSPIFKIRYEPTSELIHLLESTTLGTNGAMYKHLDTRYRILEADNPLFLSIERNNKVIGNITFCQRGDYWYLRYFAFNNLFQAGNKKKQQEKGNSFLKKELAIFFDDVFNGVNSTSVKSMYAYIDPKNDRSKWMSENFGFGSIAELATQSFSRIFPAKSDRIQKTENYSLISEMVEKNYATHYHFFLTHVKKPPYYYIQDVSGEILACAKVTRVNWEIVRLPGRNGKILVSLIPYIPLLNRLIKPKTHTFLVPEIVCAKNNDYRLVEELFSAILVEENLNLMLWWIDKKDPIYRDIKLKLKWGLLHKIIGVTDVDVVERKKNRSNEQLKSPVFVTAYDMV